MRIKKMSLRAVNIAVCLILLAGIGILVLLDVRLKRSRDREPPVITYRAAVPVYTPGEDTAHLLADVSAADPEDGDVTASLRIRSISIADDNSIAVVTYVARDRANNIGMEKRIVDVKPAEPALPEEAESPEEVSPEAGELAGTISAEYASEEDDTQ